MTAPLAYLKAAHQLVRLSRRKQLYEPSHVATNWPGFAPVEPLSSHPRRFFLSLLWNARRPFALGLCFKVVYYVAEQGGPFLMSWLASEFATPSDAATSATLAYLAGMLTQNVAVGVADWLCANCAMKVVFCVGTWSLRRLLHFPHGRVDSGKITNLCVGSELIALYAGFFFLSFMLSIVFRLGANLGLQLVIGARAWSITIAILTLQALVQKRIRMLVGRLVLKKSQAADARIKCVDQALDEVKAIKFLGQEDARSASLRSIRQAEARLDRAITILNLNAQALAIAFAMLNPLVGLVLYQLFSGQPLRPSLAWAYWSLNKDTLMLIGGLFGCAAAASNFSAALTRYRNYSKLGDLPQPRRGSPGGAIELQAASYSYFRSDDQPASAVLWHPNLTIGGGQLCAVIGPTGCGKSSLLLAMLGELDADASADFSARDLVSTACAYCSQQVVLFKMSIRENVVSGRPFSPKEYKQALAASCLERDLGDMENGDAEMVASGGGSLSGGQQMRVALARSFYVVLETTHSERLLLADDPLAALDAKVSADVFVNGLAQVLAGSTRVVAMSTLTFLRHPAITTVLLLDSGRIVSKGSLQDALACHDPWLAQSVQHACIPDTSQRPTESADANHGSTAQPRREASRKRRSAVLSEALVTHTEIRSMHSRGGIDVGTIQRVLSIVGRWFLVVIFLYFGSVKGLDMFFNWLAADLIEGFRNDSDGTSGDMASLLVDVLPMGAVIVGMLLLSGLYSMLFASRGQRVITVLLMLGFDRVLHCPLPMLQSKSKGELTSRLSQVVDAMVGLLLSMQGFMDCLLGQACAHSNSPNRSSARALPLSHPDCASRLRDCDSIGITLVYVVPVFPPASVSIIVTCLFCWRFGGLAVRTSRDLGRCTAMAQAPCFAVVSEIIKGVPTLRALRAHDEAQRRFDRVFVLSIVNGEANNAFNQIVGLALSLFISIYTGCIVGFLWLFRDSIIKFSGSTAGFPFILNGMRNLGAIKGLIGGYTSIEAGFVSAQRVVEYIDHLEQEAPHILPRDSALGAWPIAGKLDVCNITLRYAPATPPVIRNLSFTVAAGSSFGVVGRSGAGKSTIIAAVLRLVESIGGHAVLDNVDLATIGLRHLRGSLAIVPQEPVLLAGTLRTNVDTDGAHDDEAVWRLLARFGLEEFARKLPGQLATPSKDLGLSLGQSQLVCVARALLRDRRLLLLDEATSALDAHSERLVEEALLQHLSGRPTVVAIAHHLTTIMGYDTVLVLDGGQVVELGPPSALVMSRGVFAALAQARAHTVDEFAGTKCLA